MFVHVHIVFALGVLGKMSSGVPLDRPSQFSQFFESRIVGGQDAAEGYAPHMAGMLVGYFFKSFTCGGSIIGIHHVLSAAHCITSYITWDGSLLNTLHIAVGSNSWLHGTEVSIKNYRIHSEYDAWNIKNDIGVLITDNIELVENKVAVVPLHFEFVDGGARGFVTGWGTQRLWDNAASNLQVLHVSTLTHEQCVQGMAETSVPGWWEPPVDPRAELCTFHSPGHGMCHGDSGSALVLLKRREQVGVVSWGRPCAVGAPDVFVRVQHYRGFISEALAVTS